MKNDNIYNLFLSSEGIVTDTRQVRPNCIFFALKGERFNGNTFASTAIENGCSYAIIDEPQYSIQDKTILVDDVLKCLQDLANYHRKKLNIPIIAITGTNGKTTTKELINTVLRSKYNVCATKGNLNNHIGVPLTLLSAHKKNDIAIIEMGANHTGEIDLLCKIAEPDMGIITNIGYAHIEGFGSYDGVKTAKNELYRYLIQKNKIIFQNNEDHVLRELTSSYNNIVYYGSDEKTLVKGKIISSFPYLTIAVSCPLNISKTDKTVRTKLTGEYNLPNILAAIAIGLHLEVNFEDIIKSIEVWEPENNRSQLVEKTPLNNKLLLDCYNANPTSMEAALTSFLSIPVSKKVLILGEMLELGNETKVAHQQLVQLAQSLSPEKIIFIGKTFEKQVSEDSTCNIFPNSREALNYLNKYPIKNSLILLKGSRGNKLEELIPAL
ncbi:MAG: UDP-N-acetylmuramoyl-tripeptide--D-alanyl-D-alanine ligase [Bacteroidales bacterium]|nr:UDP-N-acetylmuramoyl-tripeptide--D-alanyl-D-alanine ligase [Bacteroidales bacterium]